MPWVTGPGCAQVQVANSAIVRAGTACPTTGATPAGQTGPSGQALAEPLNGAAGWPG